MEEIPHPEGMPEWYGLSVHVCDPCRGRGFLSESLPGVFAKPPTLSLIHNFPRHPPGGCDFCGMGSHAGADSPAASGGYAAADALHGGC